uniref:Peptidase M14 carboxypeptidase A domain-containing protein n=1 Tax=Parascaris equorum TaxID=6256 RepID=A0A914RUF3_PAREQ
MKQLKWLHDAPFGKISFNLGRYHSFAEIINYMNALAVTYPDRVRVGRPSEYRKPAIWIDGGIHAREWVSPAVVLYMTEQV